MNKKKIKKDFNKLLGNYIKTREVIKIEREVREGESNIIEDLMKKDIHVIIECEDLKRPSFTIGPIEKVNKKSVEVRCYSPTGRLENKTTKIKFKNITLVKFNDRYSLIFRKYLKRSKK